jgi:voltage-gated potassium channel
VRIVRRVLHSLLAVAAALAIYANMPVPGGTAPPPLGWFVFVAGLVAFTVAVVRLAIRAQQPDGGDVGIDTLLLLVYGVVVFFSLTYLGLASRPNEFVGLQNRVDALYFTMTTLSTVGYGDIHPVGQASRIAVTGQLFFDLLVLGVAARLLGPAIARGALRRTREAQLGRGEPVAECVAEPADEITPRG